MKQTSNKQTSNKQTSEKPARQADRQADRQLGKAGRQADAGRLLCFDFAQRTTKAEGNELTISVVAAAFCCSPMSASLASSRCGAAERPIRRRGEAAFVGAPLVVGTRGWKRGVTWGHRVGGLVSLSWFVCPART